MNITDHRKCCGCAACADICPKQCISMSYDKYGFYVPNIDSSACVNCKKCVAVCPANHSEQEQDILSVYKGYAKTIESKEHQKSTSGAVFAVLAENVIQREGYVIGVAFESDYQNVSHIVCENMQEVDECRSSKYIQSQTQGIYRKVKRLLSEDKPVLFSGTPCQVAALYSFLGEKPEQLVTMDFVCHGVGSTAFYQQYIRHITNGKPVKYVGFRNKDGNYIHSKFKVIGGDDSVVHQSYTKGFGKAFANNMISRLSCSSCKYATAKRVADITVADNMLFTTDKEKQYGSSLVFVNTQKGQQLFDAVKPELCIEELSLENVLPRIMHFQHPALAHRDREKLLKIFVKKGYAVAQKHIRNYIPKVSLAKRLLAKGKGAVRKMIRMVKKFK